jgi:hypothetical protein
MVFSKKKELKGHVDKTFITEDLTRHRYDLLKRLNTLRVDRKIHSVWTHDGSVLVKETERLHNKSNIIQKELQSEH